MGRLSLILAIIIIIGVMINVPQVSQTVSYANVGVNKLISEHVPKKVNEMALPPARGNMSAIGKFYPNGVTLPSNPEPAQMGIADFGIGPNGPCILTTTQFEGCVLINNLQSVTSTSQGTSQCVSFQLNVVLNYDNQGSQYALWVQDVAFYNTQTNQINFENNIWNFTSPGANVTAVSGNGSLYPSGSTKFYAYGPGSIQGNFITLSLPSKFYLLVNVSTNAYGQPVIYFWYNDGYGWINYDTVTVTNAFSSSNVYFLVDGYQYAGNGLYYDAELDMVGPGDLTCADIISSNVALNLAYWNGNNFQTVINAYNSGGDTGETSNNVRSGAYYYVYTGQMIAGLHAGSGTRHWLWQENGVSLLDINTGITNGYLVVYNSSLPYSLGVQYGLQVPFINGRAELTLLPMNYSVLAYTNAGELMGEAEVTGQYGQSVTTGVTQFSISLPTQLTIYQNTYTKIGVNVNAYGNVIFNVISPPGIYAYLNQNPLHVSGTGTDVLTISVGNVPPGTYQVILNATLFNGFYKIVPITVVVQSRLVTSIFSYKTVGNGVPQSPILNLTFPNGTSTTLSLNPYTVINVPPGTIYTVQSIIQQGNVRWATPNSSTGVINSEQTINLVYFNQYLVTFSFTVQGGTGYVDPTITFYSFGQRVNETPGTYWVDYGSTYSYPQTLEGSNSEERWISNSTNGQITFPQTVNVYYQNQYFIKLVSQVPIYALINGENESLSSGWYDQGTTIYAENVTYYPSPYERYVITSITPQSFEVNSYETVVVQSKVQFFVNVVSPIPVHASINGVNTNLTPSWIDQGTQITLQNYTFYEGKLERYVILSFFPASITLNSPTTFKVNAQKQFLVSINNVSTWYPAGSTLVLNASVPFYESATFKGNYTLSPGSQIVVNGPITENLVIGPNYLFILSLVSIAVIVVLTLVLIRRK
ncbi:thermopsin [Metallosphaera cuprina]|uniref:Peptidase A5, thermopsin n=2 Tax=Metallosphaera TaxID=41980 RepID=F4G2Q2_METCR|nr:thermopsin [Metallosphaera cuprina]AEB95100.1 peptidase A5, thermopsin [Metallosphaera cuprina Ar-4]